LEEIVLRIPGRVVVHLLVAGPRAAARHFDFGMDPPLAIAALVAANEAQDVVVVPPAMADRVAKIVVVTSDAVGVDLWVVALDVGPQLAGKLGSDPLVGVEYQHPRVRGLGNRPILEIGRVDILALDDSAAAHAPHDVEGAIARA